ncbi:hypothetical protein ACFSTH_11395 [Paenibacillus yanchengensis]|uniref:Uncharacterized protein n=1 Tax=Paenibacillus yanchengensis TaxID=2035833 RepID=A0ABW4YJV7_9BACL
MDRHRESAHSYWQAIVLLGWLTMTIGLFIATVLGQWITPNENQSSIMYGMTKELIGYIESILKNFHGSDLWL